MLFFDRKPAQEKPWTRKLWIHDLDIFWLKDEALEESANLPAPEVIAADITADLEAALEQFAAIAEEVKWEGRGRVLDLGSC